MNRCKGFLRCGAGWVAVLAAAAALLTACEAHSDTWGAVALDPDPRVLDLLAKLKPNEAVSLGRARILGEFNAVARRFSLDQTGPQSRNYSLKMVWAPERKRALFAGANHRRPHRLNDVWEFDLRAMAWILLYAPDNPRGYNTLGEDASDVEFRDGLLVTKRGGPAVIGHSWSGLTYDPTARQMLFMNTWVTKQEEAVRQLGGDPAELYKGPPLWAFDPQARRWSFIRTAGAGPRAPFGAMLEYVPELGGAVWHMNNWRMRATWLYQPSFKRWMKLDANAAAKNFSEQAPSRELVGYHDDDRKLLIARQGRGTFHFDTERQVWTKVHETAPGADGVPEGNDARNVFYWHPRSGHGLLVDFPSRTIWSYDPDKLTWTQTTPRGDPMPPGRRMLAYVDVARDVLVVIDGVEVWAFRYQAGPSS